jgi:hypothetical protein
MHRTKDIITKLTEDSIKQSIEIRNSIRDEIDCNRIHIKSKLAAFCENQTIMTRKFEALEADTYERLLTL